MIKFGVLYDLYVYSINAKIQRNKELIIQYNNQAEEYLPQLSSIKDIVSPFIDYTALLAGKINSLPTDILENATTEVKYANIIIKHYYSLRAPMVSLAEEIRNLTSKKITIKIYKEIIRKCNNKIGEFLVTTGRKYTTPFFGSIHLLHNENTSRPNWGRSNDKKKEILLRGGLPYNAEDEKKCLEAGIPYHGEKWLEGNPDGLLFVYWQKSTLLNTHIPESTVIRYSATNGNYGIVNRLRTLYRSNPDYSIYYKYNPHEIKKQ